MHSLINDELNIINDGYHIYRMLQKRYVKKSIYVAQHKGLGDAYLTGLGMINSLDTNNFVVVTSGEGSAKVYEYLGVKNIVFLNDAQIMSLVKYAQFIGESEHFKVMHHNSPLWNVGIAWNMQGYNGINFSDLVFSYVFPDLNIQSLCFDCEIKKQLQSDFFSRYGLVNGKTVVLFPYSKTLRSPDPVFWNGIVDEWKRKGYIIASYVNDKEEPIKNTIGIHCDINQIIDLVEQAGVIIGTRNGLIDLIAHSNCEKYIYYPRYGAEDWILESIRKYWSVNEFGLCSDAKEYDFE